MINGYSDVALLYVETMFGTMAVAEKEIEKKNRSRTRKKIKRDTLQFKYKQGRFVLFVASRG